MMQTFRKLSAFIMVLALMLSMSISVFAANYDAATYADLETAFADTSGEDVNINVTADIDANYYGLEGKEGITYNIVTENDSTLSNIGFVGGTIVVDTNVEEYLFAYGDADVTVNGDVNGYVDVADEAQVAVEGDVQAVGAFADATVEIGGDVAESVYAVENAAVSVEGDATYVSIGDNAAVEIGGDVTDSIYAEDQSSVIVEGDAGYVDAAGEATIEIGGNAEGVGAVEESYISVGGDAAYIGATDDAAVEVAGDVTEHISAIGNATVTVEGNGGNFIYTDGESSVSVGGDAGGITAYAESTVEVAGDVNGEDGDPDEVDYEDPYDYSDGTDGVVAYDNATVTVGGDVTGGDAYGTFGYAGTAVRAMVTATVTVGGDAIGGNVTADPETEPADEYAVSQSGMGILATSTANVSVGGNVAGGSTNGNQGYAGVGVQILIEEPEAAGSITVGGTVTAGTGENEVADMYVMNVSEAEEPAIPEIVVGSCENIEILGLSEEAAEALKEKIEANFTISAYDPFWNLLMIQIRQAKAGDEITVDAGLRTTIPAAVIDAVREMDVKLIIKWAGGEDIVVDKTFTDEVTGILNLADLAAMIKK